MLATQKNTYRYLPWNDGTTAVVESDTSQPQKMEVVAIFYKPERAEAYARSLIREEIRIASLAAFVPEGGLPAATPEEREQLEEEKVTSNGKTTFHLNEQQQNILRLLIKNKNENNEVAMSQGDISKETGISPGSVYYALRRMVNLEALELIKVGGAAGKPSVFKISDQLLPVAA